MPSVVDLYQADIEKISNLKYIKIESDSIFVKKKLFNALNETGALCNLGKLGDIKNNTKQMKIN